MCIRRLEVVPEVEHGEPGVHGALLAKWLAGLSELQILLADIRRKWKVV